MFNFKWRLQPSICHLPAHPSPNACCQKKRLRTDLCFYILVVLASGSIFGTLYFDIRHKNDFSLLQKTQLQWNDRHAEVSKLINLAEYMYEPSYQQFKTGIQKIAPERRKTIIASFYNGLSALQKRLHEDSAQFYDSQISSCIESIRTSMKTFELTADALDASNFPYKSIIDSDALHVIKDKYHEIRANLYHLQGAISLTQYKLLNIKYQASINLMIAEFLLKLLTFFLIAGSFYFGLRIIRQAKHDARSARKRAGEFAALYDTSIDLSNQQDLPSLLNAIAQRAKSLLNASEAIIFLFDEKRGDLEIAVSESIPIKSRLPLGVGIAGTIAQTREPLIVNDYNRWNHPSYLKEKLNVKAVAGVPMLYRGRLLGVLGIDETVDSSRRFDDADIRLLSLFAGQAASAVRNAALLKKSQDSEARFRIAAECASDIIYDWDLENDHIECFGSLSKDASARAIGLPETGREHISSIVAADQARVLAAHRNHLITNKPFSEEYRILRNDGAAMYLADHAQAIRNADGVPTRLIGAVSNISERKHAEQMKSDFVSFVTHQLRTPLTGMKWMLELASADLENPESAYSCIQDARASTDRLIRLVNTLLDIARLERGSVQVVRSEVDLLELTESVLLEMSPMVLEKQLKISIRNTEGSPKNHADPQLLRQVILNLSTNAAKYTPSGGQISISISNRDGQMRWAIKDNGIGIPKLDQQKLFQKFYRASNVVTVETEGTGLGLYFVQLIVERHGGRIWYESEEGAGSTFIFSLPLVLMPAQAGLDNCTAEHHAMQVA